MRCTASGLTPIQLVGSPARTRSTDIQKRATWCMIQAKLSVFWADRYFSLGRFPPLDRVDYLDHAVALLERERVGAPRPTLAEIRDYLRGAPFAGWSDRARDFAAAEKLEPKIIRRTCGRCFIPRGSATAG